MILLILIKKQKMESKILNQKNIKDQLNYRFDLIEKKIIKKF